MSSLPEFDEAFQAQVSAFTDGLMLKLSLSAYRCPTCAVGFGVTAETVTFAEQTGMAVCCPFGHECRFNWRAK